MIIQLAHVYSQIKIVDNIQIHYFWVLQKCLIYYCRAR